MQMCEHDGFNHGIRPNVAGTPLECPYRTTVEWYQRRFPLMPIKTLADVQSLTRAIRDLSADS